MLTFGKKKQTHKKEFANEQLAVSDNVENNALTNKSLVVSDNTNFKSNTKKPSKLEINTSTKNCSDTIYKKSSKNCSDSKLTKSSSTNFSDINLINNSTNTQPKAQTFSLKNIIYIIISIMLIMATIIGGVFSYLGSKEPEAIKNANITSANRVGGGADLFLNTSTINGDVYKDLLARMGGALGTVSGEIQSKGLILKMNDLDYQVVYRSKDYITLWLADSYKSGSSQYKSYYRSSYSDYTTNYETLESTNSIRERLTNTVYPGLFGSYQALANSIIATPHDLSAAGVTWQTEQGETGWYNSSRSTMNSKLGNGAAGTAAYDKLWLPSGPELFKDASSGGAFVNPGLWGLTQTELMFNTGSYCWLRSGCSGKSYSACLLTSWGTQSDDYVYDNIGVRPALHMALPRVAEVAGYGLTFEGEGFTVTPSATTTILPNTSKTITLNLDGIHVLNGVTDQWGTALTINGSGTTDNYSYTSKLDSTSQILTLTLSNVTNHVTFTVETAPFIKIINNNPTLITDVTASRTSISALTATVSATYTNAMPRLSTNDGKVDLMKTADTIKLGAVTLEYQFTNSLLNLNFSNLPTGTFTLTLDTIPIYKINATAEHAGLVVNYDEQGNAQLIVQPATGYWVNSIIIGDKTYTIEYKEYIISEIPSAFKIMYYASEITNRFEMDFKFMTADINITLNLTTTPLKDLKSSGGVSLVGVAVTTTLGGDAKIVANTLNDTDSTENTVILAAWIHAGYAFAGWSIDNGKTYLKNSSGEIYGASAAIPAELVKGKVVTACFTPITNININPDLGTEDPLP